MTSSNPENAPSGTRRGRPRKDSSANDTGTVFLGVRISKDTHQRLYRAKARLELANGEFYGMGRLVERVLSSGLRILERENSSEK